jgi:membrane protein DedA with SNARE-associated domain
MSSFIWSALISYLMYTSVTNPKKTRQMQSSQITIFTVGIIVGIS